MTKSPCKTKRPEGLSFCFGRGGRNRTLIKGFGDLCSTTEPRPCSPFQASGIITLIKVGYKEQKAYSIEGRAFLDLSLISLIGSMMNLQRAKMIGRISKRPKNMAIVSTQMKPL